MSSNLKPPPGEGITDPAKSEIDTVAFALERTLTMLFWIEEHRSSFAIAREADPEKAQQEWEYLTDAVQQAIKYSDRLAELILAGYAIDPAKRLPNDLKRHEELRARRKASSM